MDTWSKNRLQEYCLKNRLHIPNYRIRRQSGPQHALKFQVEVEVSGQWYSGDDLCSSRKQAEQSAASKAWEALIQNNEKSISTRLSTLNITSDDLDPPPPYSEVVRSNAIEHLPAEYTDVENYISIMVESFGGRVRKIWAPHFNGIYKFEIAGAYRYCDNIQRRHKRNQIYFMVDPVNRTYYQMCHNPECSGFRSVTRNIAPKRQVPAKEKGNISTDECVKLTKNVEL